MPLDIFPTPSAATNTQPNWTLITSNAANNTNTITITGISGYRKLRIVLNGIFNTLSNEQADAVLRFNSDSGSRYALGGDNWTTSLNQMTTRRAQTSFTLSQLIVANGAGETVRGVGVIEIDGANNTELVKYMTGWWASDQSSGGTPRRYDVRGYYQSNAAQITSITLSTSTGAFATMTSPAGIYIYGAN